MKLRIESEGDAVLELKGTELDGRHSSLFSYESVDGDFYLFEPEENYQQFYDLIKDVPIKLIPQGVQFEIYNVSYQEIIKPLELLPSPFNVINFFQSEDGFLVRFSCIADDDKTPDWPDFYYLEELKLQCASGDFDHITIKEQAGFKPFEGGFIVEMSNTDANLPEEAFHRALSALHSLLEEVNSVIGDKAGMEELVDLWSKQQNIKDAKYWSDTLRSYPYILTQVLSSPLLVLEDKAYFGSHRMSSKADELSEFIISNPTIDHVVLLKVLSPEDVLVGGAFNGTFLISETINGHINHQLALREELITTLNGHVTEHFDEKISCQIIIGNSEDLSKRHLEILNRYRQQLRHVTLTCFDEFIETVQHLLTNYDDFKEAKVIRMQTSA